MYYVLEHKLYSRKTGDRELFSLIYFFKQHKLGLMYFLHKITLTLEIIESCHWNWKYCSN